MACCGGRRTPPHRGCSALLPPPPLRRRSEPQAGGDSLASVREGRARRVCRRLRRQRNGASHPLRAGCLAEGGAGGPCAGSRRKEVRAAPFPWCSRAPFAFVGPPRVAGGKRGRQGRKRAGLDLTSCARRAAHERSRPLVLQEARTPPGARRKRRPLLHKTAASLSEGPAAGDPFPGRAPPALDLRRQRIAT